MNNQILNTNIAFNKLRRMAFEIAERNANADEIVLVGIKTNGWLIAKKIAELLQEIFSGKIDLVELSINKQNPGDEILTNGEVKNGRIILIDDVASSGKTMSYALAYMLKKHPKQIETLALVERAHKKFPIEINYVGISVATVVGQHIEVEINDKEINVLLKNL